MALPSKTPIPRSVARRLVVNYLYFIQEDGAGLVRIGVTWNVDKRLGEISRVLPHPVRLLRSIVWRGTDRPVRMALEEHLLRGEWYRPAPAVLALARGLTEEHALDSAEIRRLASSSK